MPLRTTMLLALAFSFLSSPSLKSSMSEVSASPIPEPDPLPLHGWTTPAIIARARKAAIKAATTAATISATGNELPADDGSLTGGTKIGDVKTSAATDGSTIMDMTVQINGSPLRFKVSAPASALVTNRAGAEAKCQTNNATGTSTGTAAANAGGMGLNVLLHGDGGDSFFKFPNQALQNNLMGVVALAPNKDAFWGGGAGLQRTDGVPHAAIVNSLIKNVLPNVVNFDQTRVFMTGVSGGSLLISGFHLPQFGDSVQGTLLACGGLAPQVAVTDAAAQKLVASRLHFQSTTNELAELQGSIPQSIIAYEKVATGAGLSATQINSLFTADNSPNGGHCEFDQKSFSSGIQLLMNGYDQVIAGNGNVQGIGNVNQGIVGREQQLFGANVATGANAN